jgi:hypothetical protein
LNIKFSDINRIAEVVITRLRFNHCDLNTSLYRIGAIDSPQCSFCLDEETVHHFLFDCFKYGQLQAECYNDHKSRDIPYTMNNLLGNHRMSVSLAYKYIVATERIKYLPNN